MTTAEKIALMQAYEDGKQIQIKDVYGKWVDLDTEPLWYWGQSDYRIKPEEPKYRPYKDTAEMVEDFKQRFGVNNPPYTMPLIWIKNLETNEIRLITGFVEFAVVLRGRYSFTELFEGWIYLDGTPCGKVVEEK